MFDFNPQFQNHFYSTQKHSKSIQNYEIHRKQQNSLKKLIDFEFFDHFINILIKMDPNPSNFT